MKKEERISHSQALDRVAKSLGYASYTAARKALNDHTRQQPA